MANLWPRTVVALTLADIDPVPVSVLGLSEEGYYTFTFNTVSEFTFDSNKPLTHRGSVVTDANGDPVREWHDWPSKEVGDAVFEAYIQDLEENSKVWLDNLEDKELS